jgi:hypothetical protein
MQLFTNKIPHTAVADNRCRTAIYYNVRRMGKEADMAIS